MRPDPPSSTPRPRRDAGGEWFELFFDLVFAVAVAQWAEHVAAAGTTIQLYASWILYLLMVFWLWLGQTVFAARFSAEAPTARILALVQVAAVGVMAADLPAGPTASIRFPLAFVAARLALLAQYAAVRRSSSEARAIADVYFVGFGVGAAMWAASVALPPEHRVAVWALAFAVDLSTPWLGRPILQRLPLDHARLPGRMGVFTSLLLYVSIEGLVRGLTDNGWSGWTISVALVSFALVASAWWIYAARVNVRTPVGAGQPYLYSHTFIVLGIATSSVGIRLAIRAGEAGSEATQAIALVAAGLFLWMLGVVLIRGFVVHHRDPYWYRPFAAALAAIPVAGAAGAGAHPIATLAALLCILVALLAVELRHGEPHAGPEHRV